MCWHRIVFSPFNSFQACCLVVITWKSWSPSVSIKSRQTIFTRVTLQARQTRETFKSKLSFLALKSLKHKDSHTGPSCSHTNLTITHAGMYFNTHTCTHPNHVIIYEDESRTSTLMIFYFFNSLINSGLVSFLSGPGRFSEGK